jgi:hypothetical protein
MKKKLALFYINAGMWFLRRGGKLLNLNLMLFFTRNELHCDCQKCNNNILSSEVIG